MYHRPIERRRDSEPLPIHSAGCPCTGCRNLYPAPGSRAARRLQWQFRLFLGTLLMLAILIGFNAPAIIASFTGGGLARSAASNEGAR